MIRTPRSRLPGRRSPCRYRDAGPSGVFEDMLTGWKQQQLARNFTAGTIRRRESLVRRFVNHTGHFPWDWTVGDADEFFAHEGSILNLAFATIRDYQTHLKVFRDFLTDPVYEWDRACLQGFGRSPAQIITDFNQAHHASRIHWAHWSLISPALPPMSTLRSIGLMKRDRLKATRPAPPVKGEL